MVNRWGKFGNRDRFYFLGFQNHWGLWLQPWNSKELASWKKSYDKPRQCIKSRDITLLTKVCLVKAMVFPVVMYWVPKNWCFWTVMLEKTLERALGCKDIKPVSPQENQPWIFFERTEAEAPTFWPPDTRANLLQKALMLGKIEGREEKGVTEGEMVGMASLTQWTWV